ncbi:unnamed protein product [Linum tenue]|uniref:Uncharacterized protein n=1 Tax=Linum tenue TaxID=586396 RepID=A0AAV0MQ50_9ROSI|nr:unnamed protein product [Linum tenue]
MLDTRLGRLAWSPGLSAHTTLPAAELRGKSQPQANNPTATGQKRNFFSRGPDSLEKEWNLSGSSSAASSDMAGENSATGGRTGVRVVVAGDRFTGKSSLIAAAATESYPENVTHVLPPTHLPADFFPDRVPIIIIDTSAAPWNEAPFKDAAETTSQGNLTLKGFLSEVCICTFSHVVFSSYFLRVTRRKSVDRKKQRSERSVYNCLVFGPENAGKSSMLNALLGR